MRRVGVVDGFLLCCVEVAVRVLARGWGSWIVLDCWEVRRRHRGVIKRLSG